MAASSDPQLNNKYMEYVVALAQHQTVSAAAEAMFISQPAMSHFIRSLENRLGVKLFNRVRNRYIPTYEGERYLFYARRIIALETQMRNEFGWPGTGRSAWPSPPCAAPTSSPAWCRPTAGCTPM